MCGKQRLIEWTPKMTPKRPNGSNHGLCNSTKHNKPFDFYVGLHHPPNDPEPGPDGRFHWAEVGDQWDTRRNRLRGRYPTDASPIAIHDREPGEVNPFHHVWTRGPDGELFKIAISEGARLGLQGAKALGSKAKRILSGPTAEERERERSLKKKQNENDNIKNNKQFTRSGKGSKKNRKAQWQQWRKKQARHNMMPVTDPDCD